MLVVSNKYQPLVRAKILIYLRSSLSPGLLNSSDILGITLEVRQVSKLKLKLQDCSDYLNIDR